MAPGETMPVPAGIAEVFAQLNAKAETALHSLQRATLPPWGSARCEALMGHLQLVTHK